MGQTALPEFSYFRLTARKVVAPGAQDERVLALSDKDGADDD
jgi:hypothetical protein